jgi:hypothetical protein
MTSLEVNTEKALLKLNEQLSDISGIDSSDFSARQSIRKKELTFLASHTIQLFLS